MFLPLISKIKVEKHLKIERLCRKFWSKIEAHICQFMSSIEIRKHMRNFLHRTNVPLTQDHVIIHSDHSLKEGVLNASKENKTELIAITTR